MGINPDHAAQGPYRLPYSVRSMMRGGKVRRCVIQYYQWPDGRSLDCGRVILMEA